MCNDLNLLDPFRTQYPYRKEYTFIPSSQNENNRSRLDFFLISSSLHNSKTEVKIPHGLSSTFFDHKPVFLTIKKSTGAKKYKIKDFILKHIDLPSHVKLAVFETVHRQKVSPHKVSRQKVSRQKVSEQKVSATKGIRFKRYLLQKVSVSKGICHKRYPLQKVSATKGIRFKRYLPQKVSASKGIHWWVKKISRPPSPQHVKKICEFCYFWEKSAKFLQLTLHPLQQQQQNG